MPCKIHFAEGNRIHDDIVVSLAACVSVTGITDGAYVAARGISVGELRLVHID